MERIILYTIHCRLCDKLQEALDNAGKRYEIIDDVTVLQKLGFVQMPVLSVNDKCMSFQEAILWLRSITNNGD